MSIGAIVFWCLFAFAITGLEIESEGKYGWAEKMPTWYRTTGFAARVYESCSKPTAPMTLSSPMID